MKPISLDSNDDESSYCCDMQLPSSCIIVISFFSSSQIQEDVLGGRDMCGRQNNSNSWLTPTHDPEVMNGLSRKGDVLDTPDS